MRTSISVTLNLKSPSKMLGSCKTCIIYAILEHVAVFLKWSKTPMRNKDWTQTISDCFRLKLKCDSTAGQIATQIINQFMMRFNNDESWIQKNNASKNKEVAYAIIVIVYPFPIPQTLKEEIVCNCNGIKFQNYKYS